jgi:predicted nucleic acid-binding protein
MSRVSVDTNVLVYAVDTRDATRHRRALATIEATFELERILTLQALSEFYFVSTGKAGISRSAARAQLVDWQALFPVAAAKPATLLRAIGVHEASKLNFWDALLVATCAEAGVTLLLTEELQDGQVVEGVRFLNPFKRAAAELAASIKESLTR